jgi:hypothetical protein
MSKEIRAYQKEAGGPKSILKELLRDRDGRTQGSHISDEGKVFQRIIKVISSENISYFGDGCFRMEKPHVIKHWNHIIS